MFLFVVFFLGLSFFSLSAFDASQAASSTSSAHQVSGLPMDPRQAPHTCLSTEQLFDSYEKRLEEEDEKGACEVERLLGNRFISTEIAEGIKREAATTPDTSAKQYLRWAKLLAKKGEFLQAMTALNPFLSNHAVSKGSRKELRAYHKTLKAMEREKQATFAASSSFSSLPASMSNGQREIGAAPAMPESIRKKLALAVELSQEENKVERAKAEIFFCELLEDERAPAIVKEQALMGRIYFGKDTNQDFEKEWQQLAQSGDPFVASAAKMTLDVVAADAVHSSPEVMIKKIDCALQSIERCFSDYLKTTLPIKACMHKDFAYDLRKSLQNSMLKEKRAFILQKMAPYRQDATDAEQTQLESYLLDVRQQGDQFDEYFVYLVRKYRDHQKAQTAEQRQQIRDEIENPTKRGLAYSYQFDIPILSLITRAEKLRFQNDKEIRTLKSFFNHDAVSCHAWKECATCWKLIEQEDNPLVRKTVATNWLEKILDGPFFEELLLHQDKIDSQIIERFEQYIVPLSYNAPSGSMLQRCGQLYELCRKQSLMDGDCARPQDNDVLWQLADDAEPACQKVQRQAQVLLLSHCMRAENQAHMHQLPQFVQYARDMVMNEKCDYFKEKAATFLCEWFDRAQEHNGGIPTPFELAMARGLIAEKKMKYDRSGVKGSAARFLVRCFLGCGDRTPQESRVDADEAHDLLERSMSGASTLALPNMQERSEVMSPLVNGYGEYLLETVQKKREQGDDAAAQKILDKAYALDKASKSFCVLQDDVWVRLRLLYVDSVQMSDWDREKELEKIVDMKCPERLKELQVCAALRLAEDFESYRAYSAVVWFGRAAKLDPSLEADLLPRIARNGLAYAKDNMANTAEEMDAEKKYDRLWHVKYMLDKGIKAMRKMQSRHSDKHDQALLDALLEQRQQAKMAKKALHDDAQQQFAQFDQLDEKSLQSIVNIFLKKQKHSNKKSHQNCYYIARLFEDERCKQMLTSEQRRERYSYSSRYTLRFNDIDKVDAEARAWLVQRKLKKGLDSFDQALTDMQEAEKHAAEKSHHLAQSYKEYADKAFLDARARLWDVAKRDDHQPSKALAYYHLGTMYKEGQGVARDDNKAYGVHKHAYAIGDAEVCGMIDAAKSSSAAGGPEKGPSCEIL